jgi:DNA-binding transcriptional LysR family regulator
MIGAGVGVGIIPESAAKRNQASMNLALIELTDPWSVRERYILTRDHVSLPSYAHSLIDRLCAHFST